VKVIESTAQFNEIVVWGHDQTPDKDDAFVKGVEEWLAFANAIHR
jgi:ribonuclease H2 subunit C